MGIKKKKGSGPCFVDHFSKTTCSQFGTFLQVNRQLQPKGDRVPLTNWAAVTFVWGGGGNGGRPPLG